MVIGIFGESCTGKSTIANELSKRVNARVFTFTGNDYLKLAKTEEEAKRSFIELMQSNETSDETIIYVISEREHLSFLPEKAVRVLVTAEIDVIKERFAKRMNGVLPAPVAAMLENKHGCFDNERYDLRVVNVNSYISNVCDEITGFLKKND